MAWSCIAIESKCSRGGTRGRRRAAINQYFDNGLQYRRQWMLAGSALSGRNRAQISKLIVIRTQPYVATENTANYPFMLNKFQRT